MVKDVSSATPEDRPAASGSRSRARFPRSLHLLRHSDFERVYKQGRRHFANRTTVFYLQREQGGPRIGFTVSKALGSAVERNRIRRRLREAVRMNLNKFDTAVDIVVNPKKSALTADFTELGAEVRRAFEVVQKFVETHKLDKSPGATRRT